MTDDELFSKIVGIARAGERCPTNEHLPYGGLQRLARSGLLRIEVFRHNYRVVTILTGPFAGAKTKRDPSLGPDARPYMVVDTASGPRRGDIPPENRRPPWKPGSPRPEPE